MKLLYRKNKKLTETCRNIFGDIVAAAYIVTYDDREDAEFGGEVFCYKNLNECCSLTSNSISDYSQILIKFNNGKIVSFSSSEWATIRNPNMEEYENV